MSLPFLLLLALALCSLPACDATGFVPSAYPGRLIVATPGGDVDFFWRISGTGADERGHFALAVPTTAGWIGFGVGEVNSGSMPGADIAVATVDAATNALTVADYHALGYTMPRPDCRTVPSDWVGVAASRNATHTVVEFSRRLAVTDVDEDRAIERQSEGGAQKFLVAWGTDGVLAYHGRTDRAMFQVNVFGTDAPSKRIDALRRDPNVEVLRWYAENLTIPATETLYAYTRCVDASEVRGLHAVGFQVHVADEANRKYLHHMVVEGFTGANCRGRPVILWGVASAHVGMALPDDISLALDHASYAVQIHYDNPGLDAGVRDSSGVDVFVTRAPRRNQAGVLTAADPAVQTRTLLDAGYTSIDYDCPGRCTQQWRDDITVFGELLHMHQVGSLMQSDFVAPNGTVLATSRAEWYEFHTQQNQLLPRTVVPRGSSIRTRCVFKVNDGGTVRFGIASSQEMCMHFIYYFPRQEGALGAYCGLGICGGINATRTSPYPPQRDFNGTCGVTAPPVTAAPPTWGPVSGAATLQASLVLLTAAATVLLSVV